MSSSVPERLMDDAIRFHGHLGAFLTLGLKAGLYANEVLGKDYFGTRAVVEAELVPPVSCFVDGVQLATGCTMGKGNIELRKGDSLSVIFMKKGKGIRLWLRGDVLERLRGISSKRLSREAALALADQPVQELFHIEE